jgi:acyl-CoA thioesterase-1
VSDKTTLAFCSLRAPKRLQRQQYRAQRASAALLAAALAWTACGPAEGPAPAAPATQTANAAPVEAQDGRPAVVFLGDSLTAGYGLPSDEAFPALIQQKIEAEGLDFRVVNAGISGDTSAGGRRRIDWLLRQPVAVLVLALGANDMLRGLDLAELRANLRAIIDATRAAHPDTRILIAGMRAAPNLGARYAADFDDVYRSVAEETDAELLPFLLEGVAGDRALNQLDGIHPTAEGHRIMADAIWRALRPLLGS